MKQPRTKGKIKAHYGIKDYYKHFKQCNPDVKVDYKKYTEIISKFNKKIVELIIEDNLEYQLPHIGSSLSIKKDKRVPRIVDGELYNPTPVDWQATNKLWDTDEEAKEKKLLVRYTNSHTQKYVFRISFKKYLYPFINKKYYTFEPNRMFQRSLAARIKDDSKDRYDAFLLFKQ
jgi:hypothetical protein